VGITRQRKCPGVGPGVCRRIIQFRAGEIIGIGSAIASSHKHLAIGQRSSRMQIPRCAKRACSRPGIGCRVIDLDARPGKLPPATSTLPLASSVAVWYVRPVASGPAGVQVSVAGSYSSALASQAEPEGGMPYPAAARTLPLGSSVAVWLCRAVASAAAGVQVLFAGSYSSALARGPLPRPPATSTFPLASSVDVCE
jgi:hypothetical protein